MKKYKKLKEVPTWDTTLTFICPIYKATKTTKIYKDILYVKNNYLFIYYYLILFH